MTANFDYHKKFTSFKNKTLYEALAPQQQAYVRSIAFAHGLSFQEFRQVVEVARDLSMWGEADLAQWWQEQSRQTTLQGVPLKKHLLQKLHAYVQKLKQAPKKYPQAGLPRPHQREKHTVTLEESDKKVYGMCPVASEETVCCNLRTIDAVENCAFGCSYCTIQTFYSDRFAFDANFAEKLKAIPLEPNRFYHFGTGQASDSLVWGNRHGILDGLCQFAADHANVLLEFKTKSDNVHYFLENEVPRNIVCSWSLNTPTIIRNEEHFTANLQQRLAAARLVADRGIKVAFHFHPMVYYQGWREEYPEIAARVMAAFQPREVLFISFGSITMIKPAVKKIRKLGHATRILQMEMVPDPHGKLTYPDEIKVAMFRAMYNCLQPWRDEVFMYLCMEKALIWQKTFGYVYSNNEAFERAFLAQTMSKLAPRESFTLNTNPKVEI